MPTIKVSEILDRANTILQDLNIRWSQSEKINWLNEAYRAIVLIRPDLNMKTVDHSCVAGTKQTLAATDALRLHSVIRNKVSGKAIRHIQQRVLDDQVDSWHSGSGVTAVQFFVHDPLNPKTFYLYPSPAVNHLVEVVHSAVPTFHALDYATAGSNTISLDDSCAPVLLDYILYRSYTKDAEYTENAQRAAAHFQTFQAALTAGTQAATAMAPADDGKPT